MKRIAVSPRSMFVACAAFIAASVPVLAQVTTPEASPVKKAPTPIVDGVAQTSAEVKSSDVLTLSPFVVSQSDDSGYKSKQTLIGSRSAKDLMDIPTSVAIITAEQLNDLNATNVSQALAFGVSGVTRNQAITDDVDIRGFRSQFTLRNGVTKNSFTKSPIYDVERIEVLKGPGALLLGNNDFLGGAVNLISILPTATPSRNVQATFASYNYVRLAANVMGPAVKSDDFKMNYRLTAGATRADKPKDIESEDNKFIGFGLATYFGKKISILMNGYYYRDEGYSYWADFLDLTATEKIYPGAPGGKGNLTRARLNQYSTESFSPGRGKDANRFAQDNSFDVTILANLTENGNLRAYYSYGYFRDDLNLIRGIGLAADNFTLTRQDIPYTLKSAYQTTQVDYLHRLPTKWFDLDSSLGVDSTNNEFRQFLAVNVMPTLDTRNPTYPDDDVYFSTPKPGRGLRSPIDFTSTTAASSAYIQQIATFWDKRIILVGGKRWFWRTGTVAENFIANTITKGQDTKYSTHKYGVVVKPMPWLSVYYTDVKNLFPFLLAGSGSTASATNADKFVLNDALGPKFKDSEGTLKEYGVKIDKALSGNVVLYGSLVHFEMARTNVRTTGVLPDSGNIGILQSAKDTTEGWEVDMGVIIQTENGRADIKATYFTGDSTTATDPTLQAGDFVPKKYSLMGKYTWTRGTLKGLMLGGGFMDQTAKRVGTWEIDFPMTANVFASYKWRKDWEVQLNLDNIGDKYYLVSISNAGLAQTADTFRARFAVKYKW